MANFSEKVSFIWSVADLLRGPYRPNQYGKVILPMTVLRRLDCVLEPTKQKVLDKHAALKNSGIKDVEPILNRASGHAFHNTSKIDFQKLKGDPDKIATNLVHYMKNFSDNARQIFEYFEFEKEIVKLYVDKRLADVQAVQTLSRLNRTHAGKEDTFVLDFVNEAEDIQAAFKPYYEVPLVDQQAEPSQLYSLQSKMADEQVYYGNEVEEFAKVFFKPKAIQSVTDHAMMEKILSAPAARFSELAEEKQQLFRALLVAYRNLYSFMSQIIPFEDADLEKLYVFVRLLINKLPKTGTGPNIVLDDEVGLKYYRLQKISEGSIALSSGDRGSVSAPTEVGTGADRREEVELSRLIDVVNDRFGTDFKPADQLFFDQIKEEAVADTAIQQAAQANTLENFGYVFDKALEDKFIDRMDQNQEIFARYMNDEAFKKVVAEWMRKQVYEQVRMAASKDSASMSAGGA